MNVILKNKTSGITSIRIKQQRARRNQSQTQENLFRGSSHCSTSPPSHYEGFSLYPLRKLPQRNLTPKGLQFGLLKTGVPNSNNNILHTRGTTTQKNTSHFVIQEDHKHSLTTSYKVEYDCRLKKLSERRKISCRDFEDLKPTEKLLKKKNLEMESNETLLLKTLETWIIFLFKNQNPCPLFIGKG